MKPYAVLFLAVVMLFCSCALAQTLPGNAVFSPGLVRLSEKMAQEPAVIAEAGVTIDDAFYARDLSVLRAMLDGTTLRYTGAEGAERLIIERAGETLGDYALAGDALLINGRSYALSEGQGVLEQIIGREISGYEMISQAALQLQEKAVLERVPLSAVADFLERLQVGDNLPFGFTLTQAITLKRTMSDDGTRLTRVDFRSGAIGREGEEPYVITGYMRQPAGRAPKDTFELVVRQDDRNFLELSYSALRENTVKSKNKRGEASVRTSVKAAGKIAGSGISSRLTVIMTNAWEADGEALDEKVTVSATLTHQDNTPGRRMQRLNEADIKLRNVIRLKTHEAGDEVISLTDDMTLEAVMDDNTFLTAGADLRMEIGAPVSAMAAVSAGDMPIHEAMEEAVRDLAAAVYRTLEEDTLNKAAKGL